MSEHEMLLHIEKVRASSPGGARQLVIGRSANGKRETFHTSPQVSDMRQHVGTQVNITYVGGLIVKAVA